MKLIRKASIAVDSAGRESPCTLLRVVDEEGREWCGGERGNVSGGSWSSSGRKMAPSELRYMARALLLLADEIEG